MIRIGMVGSGFAARLHMDSYRQLGMSGVSVTAVCSKDDTLPDFAKAWGIPKDYGDLEDLLKDPEIDLIDISTPPALHKDMIVSAMRAGKHVICEKPLTGFFAPAVDADGKAVSRALMLRKAEDALAAIREAMEDTGKHLYYAENYVYAPSVQKCAEFLRRRRDKVLLIKGEESHSGSHAAHAPYWKLNGGGALIRQGCHPLSAALYLKQVEAAARGEDIRPVSVTAVTGNLSAALKGDEHRYIAARPVDVEDFADVIVAFSDGSMTQITAAMQDAARACLGSHDFRGFMSSGRPVEDTVRTLTVSEWSRDGAFLRYDVTGSGFLYNMVRILAGTMLEIGKGQLPADAMETALRTRLRSDAGPTAPAHGLTLMRVQYPDFDTEEILRSL